MGKEQNVLGGMKMTQYKELFEKSGLKRIADELEYYEINEGCTSPKTILGLPMNVLKRFNTFHGEKVLRKRESREALYRVYQKYYDLFTSEWNKYQCDFWMSIYLEIPDECLKELAKILMMLKKIDSVLRYRKYLRYLKNRSQLLENEEFPVIFKSVEEEALYFEKASSFLKWSFEESNLNEKIKMRKDMLSEELFYENSKYIIQFPESIKDFARESRDMKNCLWMYTEDHAIGRRIILFVRRKKSVDDSFVDIELSSGGLNGYLIVQAKGRFNNPIDYETCMFLVDFAESKNLTTDYCEDMMPDNLLV